MCVYVYIALLHVHESCEHVISVPCMDILYIGALDLYPRAQLYIFTRECTIIPVYVRVQTIEYNYV